MAREVVDESTFLAIERQFHDRYADIVDWDEPIGDSLGYQYCEEAEEKVRQLLANVGNLQVLEIGSGHGNSALILAKCGAIVTSIDISPKLIEGCKHRSAVHNLSVDFRVMNACKLEFPDESFDIVTAVRTVHHLPDVDAFYHEAKRVLKPKGALVLLEPQKYNPFVELGRRFIKRGPEWRTATEHPFVPRDLALLRREFATSEKWEYGFLVSACQVFNLLGWKRAFTLSVAITRPLDRMLQSVPVFRPLYWQVVVHAVKASGSHDGGSGVPTYN
jgi:ubiquinone/menaquinone biosynthesis C-methylase UbiE